MEAILLIVILLVGLAILYFQIKAKPKQEENVTEKIKQEIVRIDQLIVKKQKEMNELQKVLMIEPAKINILGDTYEELRNEIKQLGEKLKEHKQMLQEN